MHFVSGINRGNEENTDECMMLFYKMCSAAEARSSVMIHTSHKEWKLVQVEIL